MNTEIRHEFTSRTPPYLFVGLGLPLTTIGVVLFVRTAHGPNPGFILYPICFILLGCWNLYGFRDRQRPVIRITGEEIVHQPTIWPFPRRVRHSDIQDVGAISRLTGWLRIRPRSGKSLPINLRELRPADQREVVRILESVAGSTDSKDERHEG